ncbi:MAG TPA: hypothetical protein VGI95_07035 [Caulobacteraceae bacterium]
MRSLFAATIVALALAGGPSAVATTIHGSIGATAARCGPKPRTPGSWQCVGQPHHRLNGGVGAGPATTSYSWVIAAVAAPAKVGLNTHNGHRVVHPWGLGSTH